MQRRSITSPPTGAVRSRAEQDQPVNTPARASTSVGSSTSTSPSQHPQRQQQQQHAQQPTQQSSQPTATTSQPTTFDWGNLSNPISSLGPGRPAPAIPANIFAGSPSTAGNAARPYAVTAHASMRPFSSSLGNPSAKPAPKEADGIISPLGHKGDSREWTYFGIDFVVGSLAHFAGEQMSAPPLSPMNENGPSSSSSRRPLSQAGSLEIFSASFGDGRWKVELYKGSQDRKQSLSLSIICLLIDTTLSTITVPTTVMYGIREPNKAAARQLGSSKWVYQRWHNNFTFSALRDSLDDLTFPSLEDVLQSDSIRKQDSFVLTIQIQSPTPTVQPLVEQSRLVPHTLLSGMRNLLDDKATGDVAIITYESRHPGREAASTVSNDEDSCLFRKRILYAHSAILKARSSYFHDMLSESWAETANVKSTIKIEDFDFVTVYWFLHYLYTDDITFDAVEDVRKHSTESLPQGWSCMSEHLPWDDFYANDVHKLQSIHAQGRPAHSARSASGDSVSVSGGTDDGASVSLSVSASGRSSSLSKSTHSLRGQSTDSSSRRHQPSMSSPPSSFSKSKAGLSPTQLKTGATSTRSLSSLVRPPHQPQPPRDPHAHPAAEPPPASPLAMYKIAHRYSIPQLADLALEHIVLNLTPRTAFPLLLSTPLWPELHKAIKTYALRHFGEISVDPEMARCYTEVAEGLWPEGGSVLLDFTLSAVRDSSASPTK